MSCRWDRERETYVDQDGDECRRDSYGDPTFHCTARRSCSNHVGPGELTCARCVNRTRNDIRRIRDLAPLMLPVALGAGVNSEAASLAGPACDPEAWSWRKIAAAQGGPWHLSLVEDDDELHPYTVLTRWRFMLSEDYNHANVEVATISNAADYLERILHVVAQDDTQDFPLLARELRKCRAHLEAVMRDSQTPERGAPCPACVEEGLEKAPRLVRHYGHWCDPEANPDCQQVHYADDSGDQWVCPRNKAHHWSHEEYRLRVEDWYDEQQTERMGA